MSDDMRGHEAEIMNFLENESAEAIENEDDGARWRTLASMENTMQ